MREVYQRENDNTYHFQQFSYIFMALEDLSQDRISICPWNLLSMGWNRTMDCIMKYLDAKNFVALIAALHNALQRDEGMLCTGWCED